MSIKLKDSDNNIYTFNNTFDIKGLPFRMRINKKDIAFSHGSKVTGDNKVEARLVILEGQVYGNTTSEYEIAMANLQKALYKQDQILYYDDDKYINVKSLDRFTHHTIKGAFNYVAEVEIQLFCEDPFFYEFLQRKHFEFLTESPKQFEITNPSNIEVFPIIGMTTRVTNSSFSLRNITAGLSFSYQDSGFVEGQTLIFDCQAGEINRGDLNTIRYFNGSFLPLLSGANTFEYVGATLCGLSLFFYGRNL